MTLHRIFKWSKYLLIANVWLSSLVFGLYILAFYLGALYDGTMEDWNRVLPKLYEKDSPTSNTYMGLHFLGGGIILALGFLQFIPWIRNKNLNVHKWIGRIYVTASLVAAFGGLGFIFFKGTVGGWIMDTGFSFYGLFMILAAGLTAFHGIRGDISKHRFWALQLFALAIGSWLYRMYYGFWFQLADGWGHTSDFGGPFDQFMSFFFYLPNMAVAWFLANSRSREGAIFQTIGSLVLFIASFFIAYGSYYFITRSWGPAIVGRILEAS